MKQEGTFRRGRCERRPVNGWTDEQFETLERMYLGGEPMEAIVAAVGRTERACELKIKFLGLPRSPDGQPERWPANRLIDETDNADDILAERLAASGESFADHDLRIRSSGRPVPAGLAHIVFERSLDAYEGSE